MNIRPALAAIALVAAAAPVAVASSATAGSGDVVHRGSCSGSTDWKLKAKHDDGRLEVEGEVDSNRNGQSWRWRMIHNGSVSARGWATTHAPSGSFEVERRIANRAGSDRISTLARNRATGERCYGSVVLP